MQRRQKFVQNMHNSKKEEMDLMNERNSALKFKEETDRIKFNRTRY